jgi:N-acetyltransferase
MTPTLQGKLVRLEPLTLAHLPALEEFAFNEEIWRYITRITTPAELRAWMQISLDMQAAGRGMVWATISQRDGRAVGSTRFADLDLVNKTVELGGTWLDPAVHRTGINVEAKLLQLTYGFETLGLNRIGLKTHHENERSKNAMLALGAVYEGTLRNSAIMPDGSLRHHAWFSITREEWPAAKIKIQARLAKHA